ncbi:MAG TPA: hypothetical protein VFY81_11395 [Gammaproteobacteria bacterium]|nr:hypothetical protein [Gammaproteobacteria bacterium]
MTNRGAAVLGVRLLALYFFVHSLINLPMVAGAVYPQNYWQLLAPLVLAGLLWSGVGRIASWILPQRTAAPPAPAADPADWYVLAFAAVGLLVTVQALPVLVEVAAQVYRQSRDLQDLDAALLAALSAAVLRLGLGLAVLFGSRGFARLIARLRTAGLQHTVSS